ncbi:MAG TPA: TIGR02147 family protein [Fibrobacteria bacterium]|nr:TIGR02147 family protein [Fibrobacteria bacterium]HOX52391.1 TIGR02147 family protein [Fibrobacteria bacterium]
MSPPNIYEYNDYRKFLADWMSFRRQVDPRFNNAEVHRRLGLPNTRSFFPDVVGGRNLTSTFVERFVVLLELDRDESRYFRALVRFAQATSSEERELAFDQLVATNQTPRTTLELRQMEFYRHWRHGAIRALLDTGNYGDEPDRIAKEIMPRLTPGQVRESLSLLADLGLIAQNDDGFWKPTENSLTAPEGTRENVIVQLQLQHLELAQKSLLAADAPQRLVATNVVSVSREVALRIERKIETFRSEIRAMVHQDTFPPTDVHLFQISLIPLKKSPKEPQP